MRATKDSGVEWLGEIPVDWDVSQLKRVFKRVRRELTPDLGIVTAFRDGQVTLRSNRRSDGFTEADDYSNYQRIEPNDLAIHAMDAFAGAIGVCDSTGMCSPVLSVCSPVEGNEPRYMAYVLRIMANRGWIEALSRSIRERTSEFRWAEAGAQHVPIPPIDEQIRIADFLDRETAKIDALIAKQEQLITTLDERKQAAVAQVLSLGLKKEVSMKESGVEWLGNVPSHWDVVPIKWLTSVRRGSSPRPIDDPRYFDENGEWAWVRISDVTASKGLLHKTRETLSDLGSSLSTKIRPGELFVSIAGTVGLPAIAEIKCCIHDGFVYFPTLKLNRKYLYRILESGRCFGGLGKLGTQLNLNTDTIGNIRVPVPPPRELDEIIEVIDADVEKANTLVEKVQTALALLLERRQALISAAVTGKLEVSI